MNFECPNCQRRIDNAAGNMYCPTCGAEMKPLDQQVSSPLADIVRRAMAGKSSGKVQELRDVEQKRQAVAAKRMKGATQEILVIRFLFERKLFNHGHLYSRMRS